MSALDPLVLNGDLLEMVLATLIAVPLVALVVGALTGRVRLRSCCATSDPSRDLRMRAAFDSDQSPADTQA